MAHKKAQAPEAPAGQLPVDNTEILLKNAQAFAEQAEEITARTTQIIRGVKTQRTSLVELQANMKTNQVFIDQGKLFLQLGLDRLLTLNAEIEALQAENKGQKQD